MKFLLFRSQYSSGGSRIFQTKVGKGERRGCPNPKEVVWIYYFHHFFPENCEFQKPKMDRGGGSRGNPGVHPLLSKFFSISCSLLENLAKSYFAAPPTENSGSAPGSIRQWYGIIFVKYLTIFWHKLIPVTKIKLGVQCHTSKYTSLLQVNLFPSHFSTHHFKLHMKPDNFQSFSSTRSFSSTLQNISYTYVFINKMYKNVKNKSWFLIECIWIFLLLGAYTV